MLAGNVVVLSAIKSAKNGIGAGEDLTKSKLSSILTLNGRYTRKWTTDKRLNAAFRDEKIVTNNKAASANPLANKTLIDTKSIPQKPQMTSRWLNKSRKKQITPIKAHHLWTTYNVQNTHKNKIPGTYQTFSSADPCRHLMLFRVASLRATIGGSSWLDPNSEHQMLQPTLRKHLCRPIRQHHYREEASNKSSSSETDASWTSLTNGQMHSDPIENTKESYIYKSTFHFLTLLDTQKCSVISVNLLF